MKIQCANCNSDKVVEGRIGAVELPCRFELPSQHKGFWATLGPRIELKSEACLCVQCGMVWSYVARKAAVDEIASGGSDELLERLRIHARPKRRWRWLLFGRR